MTDLQLAALNPYFSPAARQSCEPVTRSISDVHVSFLAMSLLGIAAAMTAVPAHAQPLLTFDSCAALRAYLETRQPHEQVRLTQKTYECAEPPILSVDGLQVDFGGAVIRVADNALRPGIIVGDLHTPPERRHKGITVSNVRIEGNRENQDAECWAGPCDPAVNRDPLWQQRLNGITVDGCDDCALINVEVHGARSGGVVVVSSNRLLIDGLTAEDAHFDGLAAYGTRHSTFRNVRVRHNHYSGFSFDCGFSGNRIEAFESSANRHHGVFIRHASDNTFVRGSFADNGLDGVYLDRSLPDDPRTCSTDTNLEELLITGSGRYGAWLDYACEGNRFSSSRLVDNAEGCFGGRSADLIGTTDTECVVPRQEVGVETTVAIAQQALDGVARRSCPAKPFDSG